MDTYHGPDTGPEFNIQNYNDAIKATKDVRMYLDSAQLGWTDRRNYMAQKIRDFIRNNRNNQDDEFDDYNYYEYEDDNDYSKLTAILIHMYGTRDYRNELGFIDDPMDTSGGKRSKSRKTKRSKSRKSKRSKSRKSKRSKSRKNKRS